jgi:hypothetical protein
MRALIASISIPAINFGQRGTCTKFDILFSGNLDDCVYSNIIIRIECVLYYIISSNLYILFYFSDERPSFFEKNKMKPLR